jgi:hypothetical protein
MAAIATGIHAVPFTLLLYSPYLPRYSLSLPLSLSLSLPLTILIPLPIHAFTFSIPSPHSFFSLLESLHAKEVSVARISCDATL